MEPPRGASSHGEIRRPCDPSVRRARRDGAAEDHALRRCVRARASRTRARIPDRDRPNDPTRGSDRSIPSPPIPPVVGIPLPTNDRPRPPPFPSRPRRARRASHRGGTPRRVRALRRPEGREHPARPPDAEEPGVRLRHLRGKVRAERPHSFPAPAPPNGHPSARSPVLPPIARAFDGPIDRHPPFETKPPATASDLTRPPTLVARSVRREDAAEAIKNMRHGELLGRVLRCNYAQAPRGGPAGGTRPRGKTPTRTPPPPPRGRGGGGGGRREEGGRETQWPGSRRTWTERVMMIGIVRGRSKC